MRKSAKLPNYDKAAEAWIAEVMTMNDFFRQDKGDAELDVRFKAVAYNNKFKRREAAVAKRIYRQFKRSTDGDRGIALSFFEPDLYRERVVALARYHEAHRPRPASK